MQNLSRRDFLGLAAAAPFANPLLAQQPAAADPVAFFLVGDTHYLAARDKPNALTENSQITNSRLIEQLNRLPGTAIDERAGGGKVAAPRGVLHAGDLIDTGDKTGPEARRMQEIEVAAYLADYGLTGRDGKLKCPVYEVHGNHDGPQGEGPMISSIRDRNKTRPGLVNVSQNGLHYSWDWGNVHFVCLGIVVGALKEPGRRRRYNPHDSYQFLVDDLAKNVAKTDKRVILMHHVDVARYSVECDANAAAGAHEWDPCDVRGYYEALRDYKVLGILYGHTHARSVFRWNGTRKPAEKAGIPTFNNDNSAHFNSESQAFLYFEIGPREMIVREFATSDRWRTGSWTPTTWRFPV